MEKYEQYEINALVGPMFSHKTGYMINLMREEEYRANDEIAWMYKPENDLRSDVVESRGGETWDPNRTEVVTELGLVVLRNNIKVVGVDEGFMFGQYEDPKDTVAVMQDWVDSGVKVFVNSIDRNGEGKRWQLIDELHDVGANIKYFTAVCMDEGCTKDARFSAMYDDSTGDRLWKFPDKSTGGIVSDGSDNEINIQYEAHCREHFLSREFTQIREVTES